VPSPPGRAVLRDSTAPRKDGSSIGPLHNRVARSSPPRWSRRDQPTCPCVKFLIFNRRAGRDRLGDVHLAAQLLVRQGCRRDDHPLWAPTLCRLIAAGAVRARSGAVLGRAQVPWLRHASLRAPSGRFTSSLVIPSSTLRRPGPAWSSAPLREPSLQRAFRGSPCHPPVRADSGLATAARSGQIIAIWVSANVSCTPSDRCRPMCRPLHSRRRLPKFVGPPNAPRALDSDPAIDPDQRQPQS